MDTDFKIVEESINNCYSNERASNYQSWRNVVLAINNYFGKEAGRYLFNLFSSKSDKYNKEK